MKILLVSQMYPGPDAPDHGVFVKQIADALEERGHELERAVLVTPGGRAAPLRERCTPRRPGPRAASGRTSSTPTSSSRPGCSPDWPRARRSSSPPTAATCATSARSRASAPRRAPSPAARPRSSPSPTTSAPSSRSASRRRAARPRSPNCGVDLRLFAGADQRAAREELDWNGDGPALRLRRHSRRAQERDAARARLRAPPRPGRLAFVGDGPLRDALEGRHGVRVVGRVPHEQVARWVAASDVVCQPSLVEPFGQALLEALAGERSVVATQRRRARPSSSPRAPACSSTRTTSARSRPASAPPPSCPTPNPAARAAAEPHDVRRQAEQVEAILERAARGRQA